MKDVVDAYDGSGNILICWEHDALTDIVKELGDDNAPDYPDDRYLCTQWTGLVEWNLLTLAIVLVSTLFGRILRLMILLPPRRARTALVWIAKLDALIFNNDATGGFLEIDISSLRCRVSKIRINHA